jgi:hypothetical protein
MIIDIVMKIQSISLPILTLTAMIFLVGLHQSAQASPFANIIPDNPINSIIPGGDELLGNINTAITGGKDPKLLGDVGCVLGGGVTGYLTGSYEAALAACVAGKQGGKALQKNTETDHENCSYGYNSKSCNFRTGPNTAGETTPPQIAANPPSSTVSFDGFLSDLNPPIIDDPRPSENDFGCIFGSKLNGDSVCDSRSSKSSTEEDSKPYTIPSHVQTSGGNKWSKNPGDPSTWSVVAMTDPDHRGQYKVIDEDGKNVAANFVSREEAHDYING